MTTTAPPPTLGQAVEAGLVRLKTVWRRHEWTPELLAEYRRVLTRIGDAGLVDGALTAAIDATEVNYPPPPGAFARLGSELAGQRHRERPRASSLSIDESALRDALAFLARCETAADRAYAEAQVGAIRRRLLGQGADTAAIEAPLPGRPRFAEAAPHRYDPAGTLRYVVVQSDGRRIPPGAQIAGEV